MPQKYKKNFKKKKYNKKQLVKTNMNNGFNASPSRVTFMSNGLVPVPQRYRCKLHTILYGSVDAGSASGRYFCKLNSAYIPFTGGGWPNPSQTLTTHQPAGYSQLCTTNFYRNCRVFGSKILVEFLPQALTDTVQVTVSPSDTSSTPATAANALAVPYTKSLLMSANKMNSAKGSAIVNYCSQSKLFGVSPRAIADDVSGNFAHTSATNPAVLLYWVVNWACPDAAVTATALEYRVKLTHYVELYALNNDTIIQT